MTSLTNEVASLKTRVATLEGRQNDYATKNDLDRLREFFLSLIAELRRILETLLGRSNSDLEGRVKILEIRVDGVERLAQAAANLAGQLRSRVEKLEAKIGDILSRLQAVEGGLGQALMDIKNIYNILTKLQKSVNDLWGQIKLIWAAILLLQGQVAGLLYLIALVAELKTTVNLILKLIANLKFKIGPAGKDGRDGKDGAKGLKGDKGDKGESGQNGKDGANGRDGKDGKDGGNGSSGSNGKDGRDGKDGKDGKAGRDGKDGKDGGGSGSSNNLTIIVGLVNAVANLNVNLNLRLEFVLKLIANLEINLIAKINKAKVEFTTIQVTIFQGCDSNNNPIFAKQNVQVIKGLEVERAKEFEELAQLRAKQACESNSGSSVPLHIGERYEHLAITNQLILEFKTVDRKGSDKDSKWHLYVPSPKPCEEYVWANDFEPLIRTLGTTSARIEWQNHTGKTTAYFRNEDEAQSFMENLILPLSTLTPVRNAEGKAVRISKNGSPRRTPRNRQIRCTRVVWVEIGANGETSKTKTFIRPESAN